MKERTQENCVRRLARRHGYVVRKSRQRKHVPNLDNHGEYMLVDPNNGVPLIGWHYDATLDDIERFLGD